MSAELDRQAYLLICRLGRISLAQTARVIAQLLQRQNSVSFEGLRSRRHWQPAADYQLLEQHPAVCEYRRLIWRGWHIDYDHTPRHYTPGAKVVMRRGKRLRVLTVDRG